MKAKPLFVIILFLLLMSYSASMIYVSLSKILPDFIAVTVSTLIVFLIIVLITLFLINRK